MRGRESAVSTTVWKDADAPVDPKFIARLQADASIYVAGLWGGASDKRHTGAEGSVYEVHRGDAYISQGATAQQEENFIRDAATSVSAITPVGLEEKPTSGWARPPTQDLRTPRGVKRTVLAIATQGPLGFGMPVLLDMTTRKVRARTNSRCVSLRRMRHPGGR